MKGDRGRWLDRDAVLVALARDDGVVVLPTDTVCGLHARVDRPRALAALTELKGRPLNQSYVVLCADPAAACELAAELPPAVRAYLDRLWPGPFSAILPAAAGLPPAIVATTGTVAVRVPGWKPLRDLLRRTGPLASTSVNRSGEPPARDLEAAARLFPDLPAWRIDEAAGPTSPSALVDLTGEEPRLLREGPRPLPGRSPDS